MSIEPAPTEDTEAGQTLLARLGRGGGRVPAGRIVAHVVDSVPAAERPARVEALKAVVRRFEMARKDELRPLAYADVPAKRLELINDLIAQGEAAETDPALDALLRCERDRLAHKLETALGGAEIRAALKALKRKLYPYQREGVERFLAEGGLLLADDMGLGKTAQAIAAVDVLRRTRRVSRGLIIAPDSLKPQWAREWARFSDLPIQVVDGGPAERKAFHDQTKSGLLIINYEQLIRDLETIRGWKPEVVVLDEAQRIKSWATRTALSVKRLEPKWRLTPRHSIDADAKAEVVGVRRLEAIRERLKPCKVRRVRQDVVAQLPPRTDARIPVEMTDEPLGKLRVRREPQGGVAIEAPAEAAEALGGLLVGLASLLHAAAAPAETHGAL